MQAQQKKLPLWKLLGGENLVVETGADFGAMHSIEHLLRAIFHIDCNASYSLDDSPLFRELDQFGLAMIEQPLAHDDLLNHAKLQSM